MCYFPRTHDCLHSSKVNVEYAVRYLFKVLFKLMNTQAEQYDSGDEGLVFI